nr:hypothetical protein [Anaerolinea sp.]
MKKFFSNLPVHIILIGLCVTWLLPAVGLLVTSFRPIQAIDTTGWWQVMQPPRGTAEYNTYCAACHGSDGKALPGANLTDSQAVQNLQR